MSLRLGTLVSKIYTKYAKWGTKAEYKLARSKVSFAAMAREIDRGKIAVKVGNASH